MKLSFSSPFQLLMIVAVSAVLFSCSSDDKSTRVPSTGRPSEVVVVAENNLWRSSAGDSLRELLGRPVEGLPQPEPYYKPVQIKLDEFGRLLKTHRNIFIMTIDSSYKKPIAELTRDIWAAPQRVVKITSPSIEGIKEVLAEKSEEILNLYNNAEIERLQKLYAKSTNLDAKIKVKEVFHLDMNIPADYFLAVEKENFMWLRHETSKTSQGILIYSYPYTDTLAFKPEKIKFIRNQFTRMYVPGPSDSSYMVVADEFIPLSSKRIQLKNQFAIETRGLWEVEKDFMGGPFINYTFVDTKNNMVIALDCYVYAPNDPKFDLLRQVQAVLLTFKLTDE